MTFKAKTVVRDLGFGKVIQTIRDVSRGYITVGIHGDQVTDGFKSLALVASANEFGTRDGHVPERSFIRSTFDTQKPEIRRVQRAALMQVVFQKITVKQGLGMIGAYVQSEIRNKIRSDVPPVNADSTIAAKGSSGTLRDTGQLIQGIEYQVHFGAREVGGKADET